MLNPKQQRFVDEYLKDRNATQAAIRAGYSKKTAGSQGHDLLKKPEISEAIRAASEHSVKRTQLTADWVIRGLQIEARRKGKGSSHSARVQAYKLLADYLRLFAEQEPLEVLLARFPSDIAQAIRGYLANPLPAGGSAASVPSN